MNRLLAETLIERLGVAIEPGVTVAVLGLAYKPFSDLTEGSQGILLARTLAERGARVVANDPLATASARKELGDRVTVLESVDDCLKQASVVIVTTADPIYAALDVKDFAVSKQPVAVVDCWRILSDKLSNQLNIVYLPIERSTASGILALYL